VCVCFVSAKRLEMCTGDQQSKLINPYFILRVCMDRKYHFKGKEIWVSDSSIESELTHGY
jgi:hypothetical protein